MHILSEYTIISYYAVVAPQIDVVTLNIRKSDSAGSQISERDMNYMKHNMKAGIKRILYGVYTYGYELVKPNVTFTDIKDYYDGRDY